MEILFLIALTNAQEIVFMGHAMTMILLIVFVLLQTEGTSRMVILKKKKNEEVLNDTNEWSDAPEFVPVCLNTHHLFLKGRMAVPTYAVLGEICYSSVFCLLGCVLVLR